ncbi:MAG: gluconate 2-dehydrogenase subunit 3 family protein, partial [Mangrovibacterium sp.]|nr:gluconate 2-dehydrogenase subunit 3 family protein [Mangrovibacterium sp.]
MKKNTISRRHFIRMATLASGSVLLLPACVNRPGKSSWRFFTETEASLVDAIAEQMIPTDEWPGGKDAGVTNFIDRQLTGPYARFQETYRKGLTLIRQTCKR